MTSNDHVSRYSPTRGLEPRRTHANHRLSLQLIRVAICVIGLALLVLPLSSAQASQGALASRVSGRLIVGRPGAVRTATVTTKSVGNVDVTVRVTANRKATGRGQIFSVVLRHTSQGEYRARLRLAPNGVYLAIQRQNRWGTSFIGRELLVSGVTPRPGQWLWLQAQVVGTSPATLSVRVWPNGEDRPGDWTMTAQDNDGMSSGSLALRASVANGPGAAPVVFRYDSLSAQSLSASGSPPPSDSATPTDPDSGAYPPDTKLKYVRTPQVSLPGYLSSITDPTWGTQITRISNVSGERQNYTKPSSWNADGSLLLLGSTWPAVLLDGKSYAVLDDSFHDPSSPVWSTVNPLLMYGTLAADGILRTVDPLVDQSFTTIHTFAGYTDLLIGGAQGIVSQGDRYVVLQGTLGGAENVLLYDIANDAVVATRSFATSPHWSTISPSGDYVVIRWDASGSGTEQGTWEYDLNLKPIRQLWSDTGHADFAYDTDGSEIFVQIQGGGNGPVVKYNLATGASKVILSGGTAFQLGHVSGQAWSRPGWVYLSNYDSVAEAGKPGDDQIVALKTDGSQTVEVFASAHHGTDSYESDPMATVSRDGTQVLFASEWGGSNVYSYIAQAN